MTDQARFPFGRNWQRFLTVLNDERIAHAQRALQHMIERDSLEGLSFLDVGSGSGLSSLVAMRLGAARVHSFDYDPHSVACTEELRRRFFRDSPRWTVERGSVLDAPFLAALGKWDIVYSWGVLHHSGDLWRAMDNVVELVKPNGTLFLSIYNDQGARSNAWRAVKRLYNGSALGKGLVIGSFVPYFVVNGVVQDVLRLKNPLARYGQYHRLRGMSIVHDWLDWLGGYPFEVSTPDQLFLFFRDRGFELRRMKTKGSGIGCNEFVFRRTASPAGSASGVARAS